MTSLSLLTDRTVHLNLERLTCDLFKCTNEFSRPVVSNQMKKMKGTGLIDKRGTFHLALMSNNGFYFTFLFSR